MQFFISQMPRQFSINGVLLNIPEDILRKNFKFFDTMIESGMQIEENIVLPFKVESWNIRYIECIYTNKFIDGDDYYCISQILDYLQATPEAYLKYLKMVTLLDDNGPINWSIFDDYELMTEMTEKRYDVLRDGSIVKDRKRILAPLFACDVHRKYIDIYNNALDFYDDGIDYNYNAYKNEYKIKLAKKYNLLTIDEFKYISAKFPKYKNLLFLMLNKTEIEGIDLYRHLWIIKYVNYRELLPPDSDQ